MTAAVAERLEGVDPGFVQTRRGVRAVYATVLAWATMVVVTAVFDVADPWRITLFAAGAAFEGALLAPDPQPRDRVRTLGWASIVAAAAVVVTVALTQAVVWAAAALLVLLMFLSYALRSWSPRVASLALMGAITVYVTGAGYITVGRIGWFVLALMVGFGWLAIWETVILPDNPVRSLQQSVRAFSRRAADTVAGVVDVLNIAGDSTPPEHACKALRRHLELVRSCRSAIERQFPGAVVRGFRQRDVDQLRVALYSAQKALEEMAEQAGDPDWMRSLPEHIAWSISNTLHALATAVRDDRDEESRDTVARTAQVLRGHVHDALTQATKTGEAPFAPEALLAALTLLGGGEVVAHSVTQARKLAATAPCVVGAVQPASDGDGTQGAVGGVTIAAFVPDNLFWTVAVVAAGVFFTIVTAPVSYPAMVFWMSIAFVPLFATEGQYLDLIRDKAVAALIGGCVAAVVALTVVPIRSSRNVRPTVLQYLDALDAALESHLPGQQDRSAATETELDRAHAAVASIVASAATETHVFAQPGNLRNEEAVRIDGVHEAYLRLTPLLSDTSRRLHGWTDDRVETGIHRLRDAVQDAAAAARGDAAPVTGFGPTDESPSVTRGTDNTSLQLADSLRRVEDLAARLTELAQVLGGHSGLRAPTY
jgi:hypothetical protein